MLANEFLKVVFYVRLCRDPKVRAVSWCFLSAKLKPTILVRKIQSLNPSLWNLHHMNLDQQKQIWPTQPIYYPWYPDKKISSKFSKSESFLFHGIEFCSLWKDRFCQADIISWKFQFEGSTNWFLRTKTVNFSFFSVEKQWSAAGTFWSRSRQTTYDTRVTTSVLPNLLIVFLAAFRI